MEIGLYIHIPFCLKKCNYCDFASFANKEEEIEDYLKLLKREMLLYSHVLTREEKEISTLFIGGGTPTLLKASQIEELMKMVNFYFDLSSCKEISLESNPGTINKDKLWQIKEAGFNRLSIGVQNCQEKHLKLLGRVHDFKEALEALESAKKVGFNSINADLIFGIPSQTLKEWQECLKIMLGLGLEHLSLYSLQIEEGTLIQKRVEKGEIFPCPEDLQADMFILAEDILLEYGYEHYEISNYALKGKECLHNLSYWQRKPYLGLGLSAHSFLRGKRFFNKDNLDFYRQDIMNENISLKKGEVLTLEEEMSETLFLGLRILDGLEDDKFKARFGNTLEEAYGKEIKELIEKGLLVWENKRIRLTKRGLLLGNWVFEEFV